MSYLRKHTFVWEVKCNDGRIRKGTYRNCGVRIRKKKQGVK